MPKTFHSINRFGLNSEYIPGFYTHYSWMQSKLKVIHLAYHQHKQYAEVWLKSGNTDTILMSFIQRHCLNFPYVLLALVHPSAVEVKNTMFYCSEAVIDNPIRDLQLIFQVLALNKVYFADTTSFICLLFKRDGTSRKLWFVLNARISAYLFMFK